MFKVVSSCTKYLDNNLIFNDVDGVYTFAYKYDRDPDCLTCSNRPVAVPCTRSMSLTQLRDELCTSAKLQLRAPGLTTQVGGKNKTLYMARPAALEEATRQNLDKTLQGEKRQRQRYRDRDTETETETETETHNLLLMPPRFIFF